MFNKPMGMFENVISTTVAYLMVIPVVIRYEHREVRKINQIQKRGLRFLEHVHNVKNSR